MKKLSLYSTLLAVPRRVPAARRRESRAPRAPEGPPDLSRGGQDREGRRARQGREGLRGGVGPGKLADALHRHDVGHGPERGLVPDGVPLLRGVGEGPGRHRQEQGVHGRARHTHREGRRAADERAEPRRHPARGSERGRPRRHREDAVLPPAHVPGAPRTRERLPGRREDREGRLREGEDRPAVGGLPDLGRDARPDVHDSSSR